MERDRNKLCMSPCHSRYTLALPFCALFVWQHDSYPLTFYLDHSCAVLKSNNGPALSLGGVLSSYRSASHGLGKIQYAKVEVYIQCCKNKTEHNSRAAAILPKKQHLVSFLPVPTSVKILVMKFSIHFLVSLFSTVDLLQQHNPLANE